MGDYVADILVEDKVILELKSVKEIHPAHEAQLVNYLKARQGGRVIDQFQRPSRNQTKSFNSAEGGQKFLKNKLLDFLRKILTVKSV